MKKIPFETLFKSYLFPIVMSGFAWMITSKVTESSSDLKLLLAHDNAQIVEISTMKTTITELQGEIKVLRDKVDELRTQMATQQPGKKVKKLIYDAQTGRFLEI